MRVWRISAYADLSGKGGLYGEGRWHEPGHAIVYTADHPASALLEMLVHVDAEDLPRSYRLLEIKIPDGTRIETPKLTADWRDQTSATRRIGVRFLVDGKAAILSVPSAIVPFAANYLLNPALVDEYSISIVGITEHPIDPRLLG
jgi:RES domain-containing protein